MSETQNEDLDLDQNTDPAPAVPAQKSARRKASTNHWLDNGNMVIVSTTGGVAHVPADDMDDYPDYEPAVRGKHF
jgi:hypothetical protein